MLTQAAMYYIHIPCNCAVCWGCEHRLPPRPPPSLKNRVWWTCHAYAAKSSNNSTTLTATRYPPPHLQTISNEHQSGTALSYFTDSPGFFVCTSIQIPARRGNVVPLMLGINGRKDFLSLSTYILRNKSFILFFRSKKFAWAQKWFLCHLACYKI